MGLPYMPLYTGDYLRDTGGLTTEQHGAYLLLLMELWHQGGIIAFEPRYLARITRVTRRRWPGVWEALCVYFDVTTTHVGTTLSHPRVTQEYQKATAKVAFRSRAGKLGAKAKWKKNKESEMANAQQTPSIQNQNHKDNTTTVDSERGPVDSSVKNFPRLVGGQGGGNEGGV